MTAEDTAVAATPPAVPGLPLLGNALQMMGDVQGFLVDNYRRMGPIYRVRALSQAFTVLAGSDANQLLRDHGDALFSSEDTMGGLDRQFQMRVHVLRGRPHRHLRAILATGLSRGLLTARWDAVAESTRQALASWQDRPNLPVVDACQRLAAAQLSIALTGADSAARFETLRWAFELVLDVEVTGKLPALVLRRPAYRRARTSIMDFARAALDERAATARSDTPDLIDQAIAAVDQNGHPYPPETRAGMALQGYFAGINTVAYLYSFLLYVLARRPDVFARVADEVDAVHDGDHLPVERIRDLPALHATVLETLRMFPPAPGSTRVAVEPFEFAGHRIERGTRVLIATCVPHRLARHFADPDRFDIDRDFAGARRAGVYAPFSVGSHTCLGAGMTGALSVATMAMLVHRMRPHLRRPQRPLRIQATPGPNPGNRFTLRMTPRG
ncbi:cytochrome P450 [Micromonospora sp. LOL_024]|uniref:cytochrome P450 n=1 Tax=Micromonospora sp. LOL_024 TaxID=3345412 RepID=UPI003A8B9B8F